MELAKAIYSGFLGVFLFTLIIFCYCFFKRRASGSYAYFLFSSLVFLDLLMNWFILIGLPIDLKAYHLFPFGGFIWALEFFAFFSIMEDFLGIKGDFAQGLKIALKVMILLLGCLAFFFGIDEFRVLFIIIEDADNAQTMFGYTLTVMGTAVALLTSVICFLAVGMVFWHMQSARLKGYKKALLWGTGIILFFTPIDTFSILGLIDMPPLAFVGFGPILFFFLRECYETSLSRVRTKTLSVKPAQDKLKL